jgi:hypothetical protein
MADGTRVTAELLRALYAELKKKNLSGDNINFLERFRGIESLMNAIGEDDPEALSVLKEIFGEIYGFPVEAPAPEDVDLFQPNYRILCERG